VNGENASSGAGLTPEHAKLLLDAGADCVTLGDHAFDQKDMLAHIDGEPRLIRPLNFAKAAPGRGARTRWHSQGHPQGPAFFRLELPFKLLLIPTFRVMSPAVGRTSVSTATSPVTTYKTHFGPSHSPKNTDTRRPSRP
jgi:hypothetical protein